MQSSGKLVYIRVLPRKQEIRNHQNAQSCSIMPSRNGTLSVKICLARFRRATGKSYHRQKKKYKNLKYILFLE